MFSFLFGKKKQLEPRTVVVDGLGATIVVEGKESILDAALRKKLPFPNECRVGACGTCKCKLIEGEVEEHTDKALVLSDAELRGGYILACQSWPKTNLRIAVTAADEPNHPVVITKGTIAARRELTHDTAEIVVRVEKPLVYTAGQYARVRLPSVSSEDRCYSFARAPRSASGDRELVFYVREVPGGALSPVLVRGDVVGQTVEIEGPHGEFRLREASSPMLLLAGGSGLAPIRALLEDAVAKKIARPIVLLFGARTERDLYDLEPIAALAKQASASCTFVPVLSHEAEGSAWAGARGLVTTAIAGHVDGSGQAYLCGPPPMIDAAIAELERCGIARDRIFFDKFTDKSHAGKAA